MFAFCFILSNYSVKALRRKRVMNFHFFGNNEIKLEVMRFFMKMNSTLKELFLKYLTITIATFIFAIGISMFLDPNSLAPGGVSGIAIILNRFIPLETGTLILILNVPIMLLGFWKLGWKVMISTAYATLIASVFTNMLTPFGAATRDPLLAALGGSLLVATGIGFVFKAGATTGGTDIIIRCIKLKKPHMKTGTLFFLVDFSIVIISAIVFRNLEVAMYAGISVIANTFILDFVLYGRDEAKVLYIVTEYPEEIALSFIEILDVGVTFLEGRGAYSRQEKLVIMCAMRKLDYPKAEEIIKQIDPNAFLIISSATEIYGEGYKNLFAEKL